MKKRIREKELRKLSFVDNVPDETRIISPFISYSEEKRKFVIYVPDRKGGLVEFLDGIDAVLIEGAYWSKKIVNSETDLFNECLHILYNNFSFLEKVRNEWIMMIHDLCPVRSLLAEVFDLSPRTIRKVLKDK